MSVNISSLIPAAILAVSIVRVVLLSPSSAAEADPPNRQAEVPVDQQRGTVISASLESHGIKNWHDENIYGKRAGQYTFVAYVPAIQLGPLSELEAVGIILTPEPISPADNLTD